MPIPNFYKVSDILYRGGQPDSEGYQQLKNLGVKTIISLRGNTQSSPKQLLRQEAESMGFDYVSIPLSYFGFPKQHEIEQFFDIVNTPDRQPVFLHCKHGADRTGMMIAFYRMTFDSWSVQDAYGEMERLGFHKMFVYHYKFAVFGYSKRIRNQP